jgi:hypothetical protein
MHLAGQDPAAGLAPILSHSMDLVVERTDQGVAAADRVGVTGKHQGAGRRSLVVRASRVLAFLSVATKFMSLLSLCVTSNGARNNHW